MATEYSSTGCLNYDAGDGGEQSVSSMPRLPASSQRGGWSCSSSQVIGVPVSARRVIVGRIRDLRAGIAAGGEL